MPKRSSKKPSDINVIAAQIVGAATESDEDFTDKKQPPEKNPAAVALGRLGGLKGGAARAKKLSAEKRSAIAKKAAQRRWSKD